MINKFLNAKHWQLFILMFGLPFALQIAVMISMFMNIDSNGNSDQTGMLNMMKLFPIIISFYIGLFFGWFWSVGIGLQKYVSTDIKMKIKKFKAFFFIPLFYILFLLLVIGNAFYGISSGSNGIVGKMLFVIVPIHLFSMFCIFYLLYFVSKTIKTIELKRSATFSDFAGEFFMIWFFPFGIWIIQPRINKIIAEKNHNTNIV